MHIIRCHNNSQSIKYSYTTFTHPLEIWNMVSSHSWNRRGGAHFQKNVQMNNKQDKFKVGVDQC